MRPNARPGRKCGSRWQESWPPSSGKSCASPCQRQTAPMQRARSNRDCENPGRGEQKNCVTQHANVSITTEVISVTLVVQSASEVRRTKSAKQVMKMITNLYSHLPKPEPYRRFGSGDGERKTLLTRQIASEPLPASVLFGFVVISRMPCEKSESDSSLGPLRSRTRSFRPCGSRQTSDPSFPTPSCRLRCLRHRTRA